jgi:hypothetical protein
MSNVIYLHVHYDYDNNRDVVCRDAKCYQKLLEDKKKLQEYQDQVDCDLARKENLILIESFTSPKELKTPFQLPKGVSCND